MNKFKTLVSYALCTLLLVVFYSCDTRRVPVENYKGGIIYSKRMVGNRMYFDIKKDSSFAQIRVYRLDYNLYKLGDTIR